MRVSIHQPQYLPWYPYFQKIITSDLFIFLDTVDFQKNGLQNRNRILTNSGPAWLTVPVKQKLGQKIIDTKISTVSNWKEKHMKTLSFNYGKLENFKDYHSSLWHVYANSGDSLAELNIALTSQILKLMNITTPTIKSSNLDSSGVSTELIVKLCKQVGATTYVSGIGGKNYLDQTLFSSSGIHLEFLPPVLPNPYTSVYSDVSCNCDLSIVDFLFNCGDSWHTYIPSGT